MLATVYQPYKVIVCQYVCSSRCPCQQFYICLDCPHQTHLSSYIHYFGTAQCSSHHAPGDANREYRAAMCVTATYITDTPVSSRLSSQFMSRLANHRHFASSLTAVVSHGWDFHIDKMQHTVLLVLSAEAICRSQLI